MTVAPRQVAEVGSILRARLESLAEEVRADSEPLASVGVAVRLRIPARRVGPGLPPVCDEVEVFANRLAAECEQLQTRLRQGPRVLAASTRRSVLVADLAREQRWPVFRTAARARHGLAAVQVEPLICRGGAVLGTLAWYSDQAAAFSRDTTTERRQNYAATITAKVAAAHRTAGWWAEDALQTPSKSTPT